MEQSGTTFSSEGQVYNNPIIAADDGMMSESERASVSSAISSMEGVKSELQSALASAPPSEREALESQLSTLNGSISSLRLAAKSGSKSGVSASIISAAGVVNCSRDKISDEKIADFDSSVAANSGGYISSDYGKLSAKSEAYLSNNFATSKNMSWFGGLDAIGQKQMMTLLNDQIADKPEARAGINAARAFSENSNLNAMQQKNIDENKAAIAEAKSYALKTGDKELLQAIEANEKLLNSRQKANDYTFSTPWKDAMKDGALSSEERKGIIEFSKNETARRKEDFAEINDKVFDALPKWQKRDLIGIYKKSNNDSAPNNEQLQAFVRDSNPDQKEINNALHFVNKKSEANPTPEGRRDAMELLKKQHPDWYKSLTIANAQTNMQVAEIGYDMKECLQNLDAGQRKELATTLQKMIDKGDKEGAVAILEKLNGDKAISESTKQLIMKSNGLKIDKVLEEAIKIGTEEKGVLRGIKKTLYSATGAESKAEFNLFDFATWEPFKFESYSDKNAAQANDVVKTVEAAPVGVTAVSNNSALDAMLKGFKPPATPIVASSSDNIQFSTSPISLGGLGVTAANSNQGVATTGFNVNNPTVAVVGR